MKPCIVVPGMLFALMVSTTAATATYPDRPIRVLVAQSAGSSIDTIARIVTNKLSEQFVQQLVEKGSRLGDLRSARARYLTATP